MTTVFNPGTMPVDNGIRKAYDHAAWLRALAKAARDIQYVLEVMHGDANGVLPCGLTPNDSLKVIPTVPESMQVEVLPGVALAFGAVSRNASTLRYAALTAPASNPRITLVQWNLSTQAASFKHGEESATPEAPTADAGCIPLATVYLRVGSTSIKAADDATNAYITDARELLVIDTPAFTDMLERLESAEAAIDALQAETRVFELTAGGIMVPAAGGCAAPASDANDNMGAAFDQGEYGYFQLSVPDTFTGTVKKVRVHWSGSVAATWSFATKIRGNGGALNTAWTTFGAPQTIGGNPESGAVTVDEDATNFAALLGDATNKCKLLNLKVKLETGSSATLHQVDLEY